MAYQQTGFPVWLTFQRLSCLSADVKLKFQNCTQCLFVWLERGRTVLQHSPHGDGASVQHSATQNQWKWCFSTGFCNTVLMELVLGTGFCKRVPMEIMLHYRVLQNSSCRDSVLYRVGRKVSTPASTDRFSWLRCLDWYNIGLRSARAHRLPEGLTTTTTTTIHSGLGFS